MQYLANDVIGQNAVLLHCSLLMFVPLFVRHSGWCPLTGDMIQSSESSIEKHFEHSGVTKVMRRNYSSVYFKQFNVDYIVIHSSVIILYDL
jgi:hypothetical protein